MPHKTFRYYAIAAVEGTPIVVARLLHGIEPADYDRTPDPERFTIRGILAHLADFDPIFHERMVCCRDEDNPQLVPRDENQMAIDNDYDYSDQVESLARFTASRAKMAAFLHGLSADQWDRAGTHQVAGKMTIGNLVDFVVGHDGYHTRQIAEWLT